MTIEEIKSQLEELIKDRESFMVGDYDKDIYDRDKIDYIGVPPEGCCLKEVVYCKFCKYNYGLAHGGEFNNSDIVCDYFNTDGLHEDDFCSRGIKA